LDLLDVPLDLNTSGIVSMLGAAFVVYGGSAPTWWNRP